MRPWVFKCICLSPIKPALTAISVPLMSKTVKTPSHQPDSITVSQYTSQLESIFATRKEGNSHRHSNTQDFSLPIQPFRFYLKLSNFAFRDGRSMWVECLEDLLDVGAVLKRVGQVFSHAAGYLYRWAWNPFWTVSFQGHQSPGMLCMQNNLKLIFLKD